MADWSMVGAVAHPAAQRAINIPIRKGMRFLRMHGDMACMVGAAMWECGFGGMWVWVLYFSKFAKEVCF
jgi:hypothetical protein